MMAHGSAATNQSLSPRERTRQLPTALALAHTLARQLISQRDPPSMAQLVVDGLINTFHYDHAAFLRFDEERKILRVEAEAGRMTRILPGVGFEMPLSAGVIGNTVRTGQSYLTLDTASDPFFMWPASGPPARSELCVVVRSPSRILGVLDLMSFEPGFYNDTDQVLVEILAGHLGMAIEYALLNNTLEERVATRTAELRTLVEISSELLAAGRLDHVTEILLSYVPRMLPWAGQTVILLHDPMANGLRPVGGLGREVSRLQPPLAPVDRGIVGRVFQKGQPLLCSDRSAAAPLLEELSSQERAAFLALLGDALPATLACIPLQIEQSMIGVLLVSGVRPAPDLDESLAPLLTLGNLVALSIEHLRLLEREKVQRESALTLLHLSSIVASSLSLDEVQERVVELAQSQFSAQAVWLYLYDADRKLLMLASSRGLPTASLTDLPLRPADGIAGRVFQARTIQYMPDTADAPGIVLPGSATASELTSLVGAPLIAQDEVIGALCLSIPSLVRGAKLVPDQQTLLSIFANQAAMAIANARLHQKMVRQAWESHMLAEASQRLSASLDCEWVAATIVEQARLIVGTPLALILVRDQFEHFRLAACAHAHPLSCETLALEASHTIIPAVERALGSSAATPAILETAALPPALVEAGCSGLLALPLRLQERLLGVLLIGLGSDVQPRSSGAPYQNLDLLLSLADRATLALENARLYQEQVGLLAELKALQSHLVRSETLAATGRLAASLAHEINNPLAIIRASLGMARTRLEREHPAWSELADIDEELDRISRITRSLLDFARSPAPCSDLTDLNQAIETLVRVILPRLSRQQIALSWEPEPGSPVLAIPSDSLKQIVLNLVTNAIDAMPDGGLLTIKTQSSGTFATIAVSDTGIGIPAEDLGRIFDPFFTTKRDGGTGLGLAILDRLVRTYDGRIEVESSPGHGSTFRIRLPLASIREGMGDDATGA